MQWCVLWKVSTWYFSFLMMVFMTNTNMILNISPTCYFVISPGGIIQYATSSLNTLYNQRIGVVCLYVYSSDHYVYTKNRNMELKNVPRWYFSFMMMVVFQFTTSSLNTCNDVFMINTNMILNILQTYYFWRSFDGVFSNCNIIIGEMQ